jgi:hypothetical protein
MDASFIASFNNDAQAAKTYAQPQIKAALDEMTNLFNNYQLEFRLVFFPVSSVAPPYAQSSLNAWIPVINDAFRTTYPCVNQDCILVLSNAFSTGGGHGNSNVALISGLGLSPTLIAHEIGHNLGLIHPNPPTINCPHDCNFFSTFMCGSGAIAFNACDYLQLADVNYGVFTVGPVCNLDCHCDDWADVYDNELPEDFECNQEPAVSIATDQPYLVRGCEPDRSVAMLTVTLRGNDAGVTDGILRLQYNETIYDWNAAAMGMDFNQFVQVSNGIYELRILDNGQEMLIDLAPNEVKTFHTQIEYNPDTGVDPSNNLLPKITARFSFDLNGQGKLKQSVAAPKAAVPVSGTVNFFSNGQPVLATGDITLSGSSFNLGTTPLMLFSEGTQMTVPSGVVAYNAYGSQATLAGCATMWKGITVHNGGTLDIQNTTIRDAQQGITAWGTLVARHCNFYDNNIAVVVGQRYPQGQEYAPDITLLGNQYGATAAGLKPAYTRQSPLPLGKGFAGIYLRNSGVINMDEDPATATLNRFFNLKYGIISKSTELRVGGTVFEDIVRTPKGDGYAMFTTAATGKAVYAENGLVEIAKNGSQQLSFLNCHTGVETVGATAYVRNAMMTGMTNGIITTNGNFSTHENNTIQAADRGIELRRASPLFAVPGAPPTVVGGIKGNVIAMAGNPDAVGIHAAGNTITGINTNGGLSSPPQFTNGLIADNTVSMTDGAVGIGLSSTRSLSVFHNTVNLDNNSGSCRGISLSAGEISWVSCNNIIHGESGDHTGIYLLHASLPKVRCNLAAGTPTGVHVAGLLIGKARADVAGNTLQDNATGLLYGPDAISGPQLHRGNRWVGSSSFAQHQGILAVAIQSIYTVDASENPDFLPDDWNPFLWIVNVPDTGASYECPTPAGSCPQAAEFAGEETDQALDETIAGGDLPGSEYQATNNWLAQRRLLERIADEGNPYPENTIITDFLTAAQGNGLADYAEVQTASRQLFTVAQADQDSLLAYENQILNGLDSLKTLEAQLFSPGISQQDSLVWSEQRLALVDAVYLAGLAKTTLLHRIDSIRALDAGDLLEQNSDLPDLETPYAANEKAVNDILLRMVVSGIFTFSVPDSLALESIAAGCPLADGEAVLWARALLALSLESPRVYDDEAACGAERALSAKAPKNDYLSVYPNPASDHLTIRYDPTENGDQLLLIFNNLGQLVLSAWLPGDQDRIKIATGRLPAGIYWYHVAGDQQAPASGGFIIHR